MPPVDLTRSRSLWPRTVKLRRILWMLFRPFFFRGTTRYLSFLRVALLRAFGARIGNAVLIMDGVKVWMPWNLEMDSCSVLGSRVEVYNFARVTIGSHTVISQDTFLCTATHDHEHPHLPLTFQPIRVGSQAWIASGAFVGPGVNVGTGTVVGARAVVTRDMPEWMVCAGNPCRPLKERVIRGDSAEGVRSS